MRREASDTADKRQYVNWRYIEKLFLSDDLRHS